MIYLLMGQDVEAKDQKIDQLKKKHLSKDAESFDFQLLHGHKLSAEELKKSLITLPVVSSHRVILIREILKLSNQNKDMLVDFAASKEESVVIILEADDSKAKNAFITSISSHAEVILFKQEVNKNVFDMTNAMQRGDVTVALKTLDVLLNQGDHPLQLMGGLVWFWGKNKARLGSEKFRKGLLELQKADMNIKRSRLPSNYAVELTVVKLCSLLTI